MEYNYPLITLNLFYIDFFKVLILKNENNLFQIKCKNLEDSLNIMKHEIEDLNLEHTNEIEQIKKELINNQSLTNHYKGDF